MTSSLVVRLTVEPNGERVPALVHRDSGLPHFYGNLFALMMLRMRGRAASTVEQALRGIGLLVDFQQRHGVEIQSRMAGGRLFATHEIDALVAHLRQSLVSSPGDRHGGGVTALAAARRRKMGLVQPHVSATRVIYVAQFLKWYTDLVLRNLALTPAKAAQLSQVVARDIQALHVRREVVEPKVGRRESLTAEQKALMLELTTVEGLRNPWKSSFVQQRNALMVRWLLGLGLRRGELLGITLDQINLRVGTVDIILRPDDALDPRRNQPNAKTRERRLELPKDLVAATHEFITAWRSKIKTARKHGFLFVSQGGAPLSLDAVASVFLEIRRAAGGHLPALTAHVLRYTWNDEFSAYCDRHKVAPQDERRHREYLMGWAPDSEAAAIYTKRHIEEAARRALLAMSERETNLSTGEEKNERDTETEDAGTTGQGDNPQRRGVRP